ncbi:hypothetical protein ALC60_07991 [Trachymyrmex zeteki]|uniref:Uncharacterized protein n=1 Tax=Mycetomoellerius zeteki TaxID=64791 RepID=A0A151WYG1_9HYME|nr:hypothetical protein ALC60_07991 [Trachymyrmex zeteki]
MTSGQLRRASRGGFVPSKLSWIHDVYRPVFRVQGHRVLRRVACPRTSDDISAFSGRPHGELRVKAVQHIGIEGVREEEEEDEEEEEKHEESETREREKLEERKSHLVRRGPLVERIHQSLVSRASSQ